MHINNVNYIVHEFYKTYSTVFLEFVDRLSSSSFYQPTYKSLRIYGIYEMKFVTMKV